jgi:hypothetical protein
MSDEDLMARFDDAEEETETNKGETAKDQTGTEGVETKDADMQSTTESTRTRTQYPMYLSEELQDELDDRFNKFNARRELNDEEQVEKHKHFLEGLVRSALDSDDFEEYVKEELER